MINKKCNYFDHEFNNDIFPKLILNSDGVKKIICSVQGFASVEFGVTKSLYEENFSLPLYFPSKIVVLGSEQNDIRYILLFCLIKNSDPRNKYFVYRFFKKDTS